MREREGGGVRSGQRETDKVQVYTVYVERETDSRAYISQRTEPENERDC